MPQPLRTSADVARVVAALRTLLEVLESRPILDSQLTRAWDGFRDAFGHGPPPEGVSVDSQGRPNSNGLPALIRMSPGVSDEGRDALCAVGDAMRNRVFVSAWVYRDIGKPTPTPEQIRAHEQHAQGAEDKMIREAKQSIRSAVALLGPTTAAMPERTDRSDGAITITPIPHDIPLPPSVLEWSRASRALMRHTAAINATDRTELIEFAADILARSAAHAGVSGRHEGVTLSADSPPPPDHAHPPNGPGGTEGEKPKPDADPETFTPQYVTLDQMAAMVSRNKRTLEKLFKRASNPLPDPDISGGGGKPNEWIWERIRPWLETEYGRKLPTVYPGGDADRS